MEDYLDFDWQDNDTRRRLRLVALFETRDDDDTVDDLARRHNVSRQTLYTYRHRALDGLRAKTPGPDPEKYRIDRLQQKIDELTVENGALRDDNQHLRQQLEYAVIVDERRQAQMELVCQGEDLSLRATQRIISVAWGESFTPSRGALANHRRQYGHIARGLLDEGRAQVAKSLRCVMADDVYFHNQDVKVVCEPESMAVLNLGRWDANTGLDWVVWLEEYEQLSLLVSDLGTDLTAAATLLGVAHNADLFHEKRWFETHIITPLLKREEKAQAAYEKALESATRPGRGRRLPVERVLGLEEKWDWAETDALLMMDHIDALLSLMHPIDPQTGRIRRQEDIDAAIDAQLALWSRWSDAIADRAHRHLQRHRHRYSGWRVRFTELAGGVEAEGWSGESVLNGILRLKQLQDQLRDPSAWTDYPAYLSLQRQERALRRRLERACPHLAEIRAQLLRELRCVRRSSSGVESFNSRLRVAQYIHRFVSDDHLAVMALRWNLRARPQDSRRAHRSPYDILGVDVGQQGKSWFDVIIDAT